MPAGSATSFLAEEDGKQAQGASPTPGKCVRACVRAPSLRTVFAIFRRKSKREKPPIAKTAPLSEHSRTGSVRSGAGVVDAEPGLSCHSTWGKPLKVAAVTSQGLPVATGASVGICVFIGTYTKPFTRTP